MACPGVVFHVVHVMRRPEGDDGQQRQIQAAHPIRLALTEDGDHQQSDQLDHGYAQIARAGVQPQGRALEPVRVEDVGVGHRSRVVRTATSGRGRTQHIGPQRQPRVGQQKDRAGGGNQQHEDREHRPVAAAEGGDAQRVRDPQTCRDQGGDGTEQEFVGGGKAVDVLRHEQDHDRPQRPHAEGDVIAGDDPQQIATRDRLVAGLPGSVVFCVPVRDATRGSRGLLHLSPQRFSAVSSRYPHCMTPSARCSPASSVSWSSRAAARATLPPILAKASIVGP